MEKETLEEAAEKWNDDFQIKGGSKAPHIKNVHIMNHFIEGAKWQQERMYSEEEVKTLIDIINWYDDNSDVRPNFEIPEIKKGIALIDWFIDFEEQFKKK
jgi:hypothetical protein